MPSVPKFEDEGAWKRKIESQIASLATSLRATQTSISDENGNEAVRLSKEGVTFYSPDGDAIVRLNQYGVSMYDADGDLRARLGVVDGTSHYGVLVLDGDGVTQRLWIDERGMLTPYLSSPFVDADSDFKIVTSGAFVATHRATTEQITHEGLYCELVAIAAVGTTGEMRLRNVSTGAATDAVTITSVSTSQQFRWLHGALLSAGPVMFEVQARRTAGAGNVQVFRPPGLWMADPGLCVADGVP